MPLAHLAFVFRCPLTKREAAGGTLGFERIKIDLSFVLVQILLQLRARLFLVFAQCEIAPNPPPIREFHCVARRPLARRLAITAPVEKLFRRAIRVYHLFEFLLHFASSGWLPL